MRIQTPFQHQRYFRFDFGLHQSAHIGFSAVIHRHISEQHPVIRLVNAQLFLYRFRGKAYFSA